MAEGEGGVTSGGPGGPITRRQALKRGVVLGGALAWATPVVQVVGMRPAMAQTVSPGCRIEIRVLFGAPRSCCVWKDLLSCASALPTVQPAMPIASASASSISRPTLLFPVPARPRRNYEPA